MKHAYLILAHNAFDMLQLLIDCLDDSRNDIFLHIDKKVATLPPVHADKSELFFIDERKDVRWGDLSMVEAELALLKAAVGQGTYQYYHFLSGVDLPLKSQDYIHDFCDRNDGKLFIGYALTEMTPMLSRRMQYWHLFPRHFSKKRTVYSLVRALYLRFQMALGLRRNRDVDFKKGTQFVSIPDDFARYVVSRQEWIKTTFTHTYIPDERAFHTLAWMSDFKDRLYNTTSEQLGSMRVLCWREGARDIDWDANDYDFLAASPVFFARRFNSSDPAFIQRIIALSQNKQ